MNYMIAEMKQTHSEIDFEIYYGKNGNMYEVTCAWTENGERQYKIVNCELAEATARYLKLAEAIISGSYSLADRIKILMGEIK